jgi:hypothetical protein
MARINRLMATSCTADTVAVLGRAMLVAPLVVEPVVAEPGMLVEISKVFPGLVFITLTG